MQLTQHVSQSLLTGLNWRGWPVLVNLLLATIIGHQMMQAALGWFMPIKPLAASTNIAAPLAAESRALPGAGLDVQTILKAEWFGKAEQVKNTAPLPPVEAPDTRLDLSLQGILFSQDRSQAKVIVAKSGSKGEEYQIDSNLPGGAILREIYPDRVIIERNQRYETLRLDMHAKASSSGLQKTPGVSQSATQARQLGAYRQQILQQPGRMGEYLQIQPAQSQGQFLGYQLSPGRRQAVFAEFGLQRGDIVTEINGTRLDSPVKGLGALESLATANEIHLEVLRNGQLQQLSFQIR